MQNSWIGTLFAELPVGDGAKADLVARMSAPDRHYHSMQHLALLWERHCRYANQAEKDLKPFKRRIASAIAFHDSIYVGGAKDNEERSALFWIDMASDLDEADRLWVADTIRATADHVVEAARLDLSNSSDYARQWVLDLDLTPLGEVPDVFDINMALLLAEDGNADLSAGIRHYASADRIYRCSPIALMFEEPARANFARHLRHAVEEVDPIRSNWARS